MSYESRERKNVLVDVFAFGVPALQSAANKVMTQMPHAEFPPERRARENAERPRLYPIFGSFADRGLGIV